MAESILVTGKKISSMELVTNVTGNEKIPTGQPDDLALTPNQIADHTIARGDLASQEDVSQVEVSLGTQISELTNEVNTSNNSIRGLIAAEEAARIAADGSLQTAINAESLARTDADTGLQSALDAEVSARIAADDLKVDKDGSVSSVAGRVGDVELSPSDVLVDGFGSQEDVNKYVPKPFLIDYPYGLGERVLLDNGDIVRSTVSGNTVDPNVEMTGWRNPEAEQDALNATLIKPYNPLTTYTDGQLSIKDGVIQKLVSGVWTRSEFRVDDYPSVLDTATASNIRATKSFYVPLGTYPITSTITLAGYHHIRGEGDMSDLLVSPGITGFEYNATTGAYDDHPNRTIKDVRIRGDGTKSAYLDEKDGTTTGFHVNNSGSRGNVEGVTFDRHDTGLKVQRSYTNIGRYNCYRANKVGLHLDGVTSYREEQIYARFNSTAAVLITGIMQNVTFAGGAIEGNRGRGIWVKDLAANPYFRLHLDDLYMEACGDRAAGVPAVDIVENDWVHVAVKGGSYWSNAQQGIFSGAYKWGNSVSFEASTLGFAHYAKKGSVKDGIFSATLNTTADLAQARLWGLTEPMLVSEFRPTIILNTTSSPVFQVPFKGRPTVKHYLVNSAVQNYPHVTVLSSGVTASENTAANYGDGSWTNIAFTATGDYGAGYAELFRITENVDGTRPNTLHTFLLRPTSDIEIGFEARGGATVVHRSHFKLVAGRTYKLMCVANIEWSGNYFFRMFSLNGAGTVAYLPIYSTLASNKQNIIDLCNAV